MAGFNQDEIYNNINSLFEAKAEIIHEIDRNKLVLESVEENILKYIKSIFRPLKSKMLVHTWKEYQDKGILNLDDGISSLVYETLLNTFFEGIGGMRLYDIISCGYEHYAIGFEFLVGGNKIRIDYPCIESITRQNLYYANYGKFLLSYEESPSYWVVIKSSYKEEDIADAIKQFLSEHIK